MKVSVIVPIYNAEKGIEACLRSLCDQTLGELEIVIVDDCGKDNSMNLARKFASSHQERSFVFVGGDRNLGPGGARNLGIQAANGEYVAFVDADDKVDPDFCRMLYMAALESNADLACCNISFDYDNGHSDVKRNPIIASGQFGKKAKRYFLTHYKSYFTTFIYRRQFLNKWDISFPDTHSAEDSCFLASCLVASERIAQIEMPMYHYIINNTSVSRKKDRGRWKNRIRSFSCFREFARKNKLQKGLRLTLWWLRFRKGTLLAVKDLITNI